MHDCRKYFIEPQNKQEMDDKDNEQMKSKSSDEKVNASIFGTPINSEPENLRSYAQTKLSLADILRTIRHALAALGIEDAENQYEELMVKLAEDRFILAVLGQFKRGKSSLMNAIIGRDLLPTGVLPLTSAITVLKYGPIQRLVVTKSNSMFTEEMPVSALADYVTEKGNPGNQKKIKTVDVELPVPFLRYGIEFVDTPGVGSVITANTETTYNFLPECDAVLFVTGADTPMTSPEMEFLKKIKKYVNRIFFVINKVDLISEEELKEVKTFVTETIHSTLGSEAVKVFPVSSRMSLDAKTSGNVELYNQSGLQALEETLASFLSEEKATAFLAAVAQKAMRILDNEMSQNAFSEAALEARAKVVKEEKVATLHYDLHAAVLAINISRAKLEVMYNDILKREPKEITSELFRDKESKPEKLAFLIGKNSAEHINKALNLKADLRERSCPVCEHIAQQAFDFFAHWQYLLSTEEQAQKEFAEELGFCPLHNWQLLLMSSPYGASVGFAQLAESISGHLKSNIQLHEKGEGLKRLVHNSRNCQVCKMLRDAEEKYVMKLSKMLNETEGQNLYRQSQGACLWHLGMLIDSIPSLEIREFLISHAVQQFGHEAEEMRSYALKLDALRRALQNRDEEDAYRRTITRIVGNRNVCMPWAEDGEI